MLFVNATSLGSSEEFGGEIELTKIIKRGILMTHGRPDTRHQQTTPNANPSRSRIPEFSNCKKVTRPDSLRNWEKFCGSEQYNILVLVGRVSLRIMRFEAARYKLRVHTWIAIAFPAGSSRPSHQSGRPHLRFSEEESTSNEWS